MQAGRVADLPGPLLLCHPGRKLHLHWLLLNSPFQYPSPYGWPVVLELHPAEHLIDDRGIPNIHLEPTLYVMDPQLGRVCILLGVALEGQNGPPLINETLVVFRQGDETWWSDGYLASMVLLQPQDLRRSLRRRREEPLSVGTKRDFCHPKLCRPSVSGQFSIRWRW